MKENKIPWVNLATIGTYLYVVSVLIQFGFNRYFGIPASFIESSIRANVVNFYVLIMDLLHIKFDLWGGLFLAALLILIGLVLSFFYYKYHRKALIIIIILFTLVLLHISVSYGELRAKNLITFSVVPESCGIFSLEETYVMPVIYDNKGVFVQYDKATNKLLNGFLVKELSDIPCKIETKDLGRLIQ